MTYSSTQEADDYLRKYGFGKYREDVKTYMPSIKVFDEVDTHVVRAHRKRDEWDRRMLREDGSWRPAGIGAGLPKNEEEPMSTGWSHDHRGKAYTGEDINRALDFWGGDGRNAPEWFTKFGPKTDYSGHIEEWMFQGHRLNEAAINKALVMVADAGHLKVDHVTGMTSVVGSRPPLKVPVANFLWRGESVEPAKMRDALDFWQGGLGKYPPWYGDEALKRPKLDKVRNRPPPAAVVFLPNGTYVASRSQIDYEEGILVEKIDVELHTGHFLLSKRELRWKKMKAVLLWAAVACGCTLGWNYGGSAAGSVANWWTQRKADSAAIVKAEQEYAESHYSIRWHCGNCGDHSGRYVGGRLIEINNGKPVGEVLLAEPCLNCGVVGRLSKKP